MDKYDYKAKYDEMKALIQEGKQEEALDLMDSVNWRKVHNVNALVKASEICEECGRLEDAKELLYMAHERSPIGRMILYHLAMICIKLGSLNEAEEYYNEFVEIAPHDSLKYIIKYKIQEAKGADITTQISVLEELKDHDFMEEWSYELACLYHKSMQIEKCIDLCDEIILWFGEGPYVERALEMKMIYQPLDESQEAKYRRFQKKRDGITEIRANEMFSSGEILHDTISIPQVVLPPERFNTINLQAEIKKNIDEIMRATEAEAVSENMENIKTLVEEIPYLKVVEDKTQELIKETNDRINITLMDKFQEYLAEEYDGQISLLVPEEKKTEEQVEGQMTIEDVMEEWEKTKRAAEAALQEADQQKLETAKSQALKEASQIMDRLEEVMPKLDVEEPQAEFKQESQQELQEEIHEEPQQESQEETHEELQQEPQEEIHEEPQQEPQEESPREQATTELEKPTSFVIPRIPLDGEIEGIGLEIPVIHPTEVHLIKGEQSSEEPVITKEKEHRDTKEWQPPILKDEKAGEESKQDEAEQKESEQPPKTELDTEGMAVDYKEASKIVEDVNQMLQKEIDRMLSENDEENTPEVSSPEETELIHEEQTEGSFTEEQSSVEPQDEKEVLPQIEQVQLDDGELAELVDEKVLEEAIREEIPQMSLTDDEKEIFSYFMPINGMESSICQALTGAKYHLEKKKNSAVGNIIIQGGVGSGKTMLASNLIKVLQMETGQLTGNTGKIDAVQLNTKDIANVFTKVDQGCLIVEQAGKLSETTMETMRQQMMREDLSVMVIMEDQKADIEKLLSRNTAFSAMFTEKISIPVFTIDELVNFGKIYALEEGYAVDEMGILAMYNRINLIQRLDHPTSLIEVRDIMEEAIQHAEKGGIKELFSRLGTKKYDEDGNLILHEQDFEL